MSAVSLIQRLLGRRELVSYDALARRLHATTWSDWSVLVAGSSAVALGLIVFGLALWPGRAVVMPLDTEDGMVAGVRRSGLRTALRSTATRVDGIDSARIRLGRRKVYVSARTTRRDTTGLPEAINQAVARRVREIGPRRVRTVHAGVRGF
ncbi:DUF6286 domain-containing protein [Nocardia sp. NPDC057668]|uniref:DUF6286 domain-containing protein n=1 Tax=Nocardia sp. NPDC057668 TaxID=3346202 RepID=UPI00366F9DFF